MTDRFLLHHARVRRGNAVLLSIGALVIAAAGWSAFAGPAVPAASNPSLAVNQKVASLEARINALETRVHKLETKADSVDLGPDKSGGSPASPGPAPATGGSQGGGSIFSLNNIKGQIHRVVAPFEVVDRSGRVILTVTDNGESQGIGIYDKDQHPVAGMSATPGGGQVQVIRGNDFDSFVALRSNSVGSGLVIKEKAQRRVEVASTADGGYVWVYGNESGTVPVAALQGSGSGKGYVYVFNDHGQPLASLSQGQNGGELQLTDSGGTPMVEAGTLPSHVGIVRTGPASRAPGGLMGVPGSYITGKGN